MVTPFWYGNGYGWIKTRNVRICVPDHELTMRFIQPCGSSGTTAHTSTTASIPYNIRMIGGLMASIVIWTKAIAEARYALFYAAFILL